MGCLPESKQVRLAVFSHKHCWHSTASVSGYATDGGFPFQMRALSELFDSTALVVSCLEKPGSSGESPLTGHNLTVAPLTTPRGAGWRRKLDFPFWLLRNFTTIRREFSRADAVHAPIPGDVGTIGMLLAFVMRKPLFVRHCGNWFVQETAAEHFWKWFMVKCAGGRNVMLATGGAANPPSQNPKLRWIFSTSLTEQQLTSYAVVREPPQDGRLRLIIAARQEIKKGTGVVIESLPLLLKKFPQVTFDVVGGGEALNVFKKLAISLGVNDRVKFHGAVNHAQVIRLLQQSDLFCFPTTSSEGFPKAVLEGLACGLPVITTRVSILPQLIGKGGGMLMDEASPTAVEQAVEEIFAQPDRYQMMSARAAETARQYSLESWRDEIGGLCRAAWRKNLRSDRLELRESSPALSR